MTDLLTLTRDPCTCHPRLRLCPSCRAWDHNQVLVGGQVVSTAWAWRDAYHCAWLCRELERLMAEPDISQRIHGRRTRLSRVLQTLRVDELRGVFA